jgi:threonine dehydrogenase-like Zn-dependent dehydrogenase
MLAVVKNKPEVGIEIMEMPEPDIKKDQIMIEVKACGICGSDLHIYEWEPFIRWVPLPRIIGHEIAGTVYKVGEEVKEFEPGDRVVADTWGGCGNCYYCRLGRFNHCMYQTRLGQHVDGGMAKYVIVPVNSLYKIPEGVDFEEASVIEPLGVMLHAFEKCDMKPGDDIAIIGPGPIGLLGVMLAKANGASTIIVSGLKEDKERLEYAKKFGAISVNAGEENLENRVLDLTEGRGVDIVMDVSGGKGSLSEAANIAKLGGQIGLVGLGGESIFDPNIIVMKGLSVLGSNRRQPSTWYRAIKLVANKVIDTKSIITHVLPLKRANDGFQTLLRKEGIKVILVP